MLQPKKWWIGLPFLAGLIWSAAQALTPAMETELRARALARLVAQPDAVDNPQLIVSGRDLSVGGIALSGAAKDRALADLRGAGGVRAVADATTPLAIARPFALTLERHGRKAALRGAAPVGGERAALRAILATAGLEVVDETSFAAGAPAVFHSLATFAAQRLAELDPATATLSDATLKLSGEARSVADYEKALAAVQAPPPGVAVTADIQPPRISPYVFSATIGDGVIAIGGHLPTPELRRTVVAQAAVAGAGFAVSDATQIGSGAPAGDYAAAVAVAFEALAKLAQGKVTIDDARLTIEGQGRENVLAETLEGALKARLPQGFALTRVDVVAGPVSPYVFAAQRAGEEVTLSGYAPDEAARHRLLEAARRSFFDAHVVGELKIARGAPPNLVEAAERALAALARLADGRLKIEGAVVSLTGAARYEAARADIARALAESLPQSFKSDAMLTTRVIGSALDADHCRTALNAALARGGVEFAPDAPSILPRSAAAVDALAATALRCPDATIDVAAHPESEGIEEVARAKAKRRAEALVDWLVKSGADPVKLRVAAIEDATPRDGRVEFIVRQAP